MIATGLLAWTGATWPIAVYFICLAAITLIATVAAKETRDVDIAQA